MAVAVVVVPRGLRREHDAIRMGLLAAGFEVRDRPPGDVLVTWNRWQRDERLCAEFEAARKPVIVAENGYIGGPGLALARSGHNGAGQWPSGGPERFLALSEPVLPWRTDGDHVLVCPSRGLGGGRNCQPAGWVDRTVATLCTLTRRPVRVRVHPGNWKANPPAVPLVADLAGAWACVIWASAAGIRALLSGIPVFQCAPNWICTSAASLNLRMIEDPAMDDYRRMSALNRMAWAQWGFDEVAQGEPFRRLLC